MKKLLKGIIICVVALMILNIASAGYAQNTGRKLCRGVINIASGWIEIPKNVYDVAIDKDFASGVMIGFPKGCWMAIVRTGVGIYDTFTFPFPIPKGYEPVLKPEFVVEGK